MSLDLALPGLRPDRPHAAGRRLVRRDALPDGAHRAALAGCELFVSIGTSGNVYPAAGFVREARRARRPDGGAEPGAIAGAADFDEAEHGPATKIVPAFVERFLGATG